MSASLAILLLALMGVAILLWQVATNLAALLIVAAIVALATWVTAEQVSQYREAQATTPAPQSVATGAARDQSAGQPPPMPPPAFSPLPLRRGMTGGAAPPAVAPPLAKNPHS